MDMSHFYQKAQNHKFQCNWNQNLKIAVFIINNLLTYLFINNPPYKIDNHNLK